MAYNKKTWATEEEATSTGLNQMSDNIELALRGKVSNRELATGVLTLTIASGTQQTSGAVVFATDADDGDPDFSATPVIWMQLVQNGTVYPGSISLMVASAGLSANGFSVLVEDSDAPSSNYQFDIRWFALGVPN